MALDYTAHSDEESPFPKASQHRVMRGSPKKVQPDPMSETIKWLEARMKTLMEEDVLWWPLVAPLTDVGASGTRELTKRFLAAWTNFCPPAPTMLNIGQLLDEELEEGDHTPLAAGLHMCLTACGRGC